MTTDSFFYQLSVAAPIGGTIAGVHNVISGNVFGHGISIELGLESTAVGNLVQGNFIGTDVNGTNALGNGRGVEAGRTSAIIGGTAPGAGNLIADNDFGGVGVFGAEATPQRQAAILSNSIHSNGGLGIDLVLFSGGLGVTPNDYLDADTGPNNLQNFPDLFSTTYNGSTLTVTGNMPSTPNTQFTIQFFLNPSSSCDPSG